MVVDKPMTRVLPNYEDTNEFRTHAFQNNMSFIASGNKVSTNINGKIQIQQIMCTIWVVQQLHKNIVFNEQKRKIQNRNLMRKIGIYFKI